MGWSHISALFVWHLFCCEFLRLQLVAALQRQLISAIAKGILMASMTAILRKLRTEFVRQHDKCIRLNTVLIHRQEIIYFIGSIFYISLQKSYLKYGSSI